MRLVGQHRAGGLRLSKHGVDLLPAPDEVADAELTAARRIEGGVRVLCQVDPSVQLQDQAAVQFEHRCGSAGSPLIADELCPDHPRRLEPERPVERKRPLQIPEHQASAREYAAA
jgi:hypothetical protein